MRLLPLLSADAVLISNVWPLGGQVNLVLTPWAPKLGIFCALRGKSFFG